MGSNSEKGVLVLFLWIIAPSLSSAFFTLWDDNMESYDVSGWTWLDDETTVTWDKFDRYRLATFEHRDEWIEEMKRYLWTLPEPKTGDSFQGLSFPLIAATEASCGTAVTFQIKNYLNQSLHGGAVVEAGELIRTAPNEIRAQLKEILVVKDDSNTPKTEISYRVGNTKVDFSASFRMVGKTIHVGLDSRHFFTFSLSSLPPLRPNFTNMADKFHLPYNRHHYTIIKHIESGGIGILLSSKLTLPGRFAVTIQVFPFDRREYRNKLWILRQRPNN